MEAKDILPVEFTEIELNNFHLFVKVKIGRHKARLLLDTGASKTVFDKGRILRFIPEHRLVVMEGMSVGLGSKNVETRLTQLSSIRFGKVPVKKADVAVMDLSHVLDTYNLLNLEAIDGVLGSDLLYRLQAIIDYGKRTLVVKYPA